MINNLNLLFFVTTPLGLFYKTKAKYPLLLTLLVSLMLLTGCGKGESNPPDTDLIDVNIEQPSIVSITSSADSFTIDLNTSTTAEFKILTKFDDDTESAQSFSASWDVTENKLTVFDENNEQIKIEYDANKLVAEFSAAPSNSQETQTISSVVSITDEIFSESVDVKIIFVVINDEPSNTIPEEPKSLISLLLPQTFVTGFVAGDSASIAIKAKKDDGSLIENVLPLVSCSAKNNDVVIVENNCQLTAVSEGEENITITLLTDDNVSANIVIKVLPKPIPVVVSAIIPAIINTPLHENDEYQLAAKVQYSDESLEENAISLLNCAVENNDVIQLTDQCELTAVGVGDVDIIFTVKNNLDISATLTVTILPPYLTNIYFSLASYPLGKLSLELDENLQLVLVGDLSNGQPATDDLFQWVRCVDNTEFFNVTDSCVLTAISEGVADVSLVLLDGVQNNTQPEILLGNLSVTVLKPVTVTELIVTGVSQLWVDRVVQYSLSAKFSNGDVLEDARNIAKCISADEANTSVIVNDNCSVTGSVIGEGSVSAVLNNLQSQTAEPIVTSQSVIVAAAPDILDSQPVNVTAGGNVEYPFETNLQTTYKVKLVSETGLPIEARISLSIYIGDSNLSSCSNEIAADKSSLACGVDTTGTAGKLFIGLDNASMSRDFVGFLELSFDDDILNNDDGGQISLTSINGYQLLIVNDSPFNGHVSSNINGANTSRYRTDNTNGLLVATSGYQVNVVFEPDLAGDYHFDLSSVQVGWEYNTANKLPSTLCTTATCTCRLEGNDAIVCDVLEGGKTDLFVMVYGNGNDVNSAIPSSATADGELSYTVSITNTP